VVSNLFKADPALGFPAGAPLGYPEQLSVHGTIHAFAPLLAFLSVIAACFVIARRFVAERMRRAAVLTRVLAAACSCSACLSALEPACASSLQLPSHSAGSPHTRYTCDAVKRARTAHGLMAMTMSRRIEESTRCSKSR
jgi:hypothetical protein